MSDDAPPRLTVACLCAQWCGTCRDYRAVFDAAVRAEEASHPAHGIGAVWIDIEDEADLLGSVDVENFPTLLLARGDAVLFFGTVTPHAATLARLIQAALEGGLAHQGGESADDAVQQLASRLRQR